MPGDKREARLPARCPGHPRPWLCHCKRRTWMAGTKPGHDEEEAERGWPGHLALRGAKASARAAEFVEMIQSDLPCPVSFAKIFLSPSHPNQNYNRAVPSHRGAARDRHERGTGCGGR